MKRTNSSIVLGFRRRRGCVCVSEMKRIGGFTVATRELLGGSDAVSGP